MLLPLFPLPVILTLILSTSTATAASRPRPAFGPPIPLNLTDLFSPLANTTALPLSQYRGFDPGFTVHVQLGQTSLRPLACLMNVVNAMTSLALQDFTAVTGPVTARLPNYPDVRIRSGAAVLSPGTIPIRYVIWGVWSAALFMMNTNQFQTLRLTLSVNMRNVGYIVVERPDPQVLSLGGGSNDGSVESLGRKRSEDGSAERREKRSDVAIPAMASSKDLTSPTAISNSISLSITNTTSPLKAGDLHVFVKAVGQRLTNSEFFKPILAGLEFVAHFPSTSQVNGFILRNQHSDMWMEFRDFGPRRSEPPFFEYQCIVATLGYLPELVVQQLGRWSEVIIVMQLDGIRVGDGWLRKGVP